MTAIPRSARPIAISSGCCRECQKSSWRSVKDTCKKLPDAQAAEEMKVFLKQAFTGLQE
jgi:hypothetical protein